MTNIQLISTEHQSDDENDIAVSKFSYHKNRVSTKHGVMVSGGFYIEGKHVKIESWENHELKVPEVPVIPLELVSIVMGFLDGCSLIACTSVCHSWTALTQNQFFWRTICIKQWPILQHHILPQLPGAPDYDLIRLYQGSWKNCFLQKHQKCQRKELTFRIPNFSSCAIERIVSEPFTIEDHTFCLWIFPRGNPHEPEYAGHVLSVYLVLTATEKRPVDWLTCAVFTLSVMNFKDPERTIEWHSSLADNRFDKTLFNWGVHSLGDVTFLSNPSNGFVQNDTLEILTRVRIMTLTFKICHDAHLLSHHGLSLTSSCTVDTIVMPFCSTLNELVAKLMSTYNIENEIDVDIWCFNQTVMTGQALRPRKLLTSSEFQRNRVMFGYILHDGIDIDAYSNCFIYFEMKRKYSITLKPITAFQSMAAATSTSTTTTTTGLVPPPLFSSIRYANSNHTTNNCSQHNVRNRSIIITSSSVNTSNSIRSSSLPNNGVDSIPEYLFVKIFDPTQMKLQYIGRVNMLDPTVTVAGMFEYVSAKWLNVAPECISLYKEEMAPLLYSSRIEITLDYLFKDVVYTETNRSISGRRISDPCDTMSIQHNCTVVTNSSSCHNNNSNKINTNNSSNGIKKTRYFQAADIIIFVPTESEYLLQQCMQQCLYSLYDKCYELIHTTLHHITLEEIENICEQLDIPKFRVRSAYKKCQDDGKRTLEYIVEGRHLGFICDCCGETDFKGCRYNCLICTDYDLCTTCYEHYCHVSHRYANVDGKWQRIYNFLDHSSDHAMKSIIPVFFTCNL